MSVPRKRRGRPAFAALVTAIPAPLKTELVAAADEDDCPQREIVEQALTEFFKARRSREPSPSKSA